MPPRRRYDFPSVVTMPTPTPKQPETAVLPTVVENVVEAVETLAPPEPAPPEPTVVDSEMKIETVDTPAPSDSDAPISGSTTPPEEFIVVDTADVPVVATAVVPVETIKHVYVDTHDFVRALQSLDFKLAELTLKTITDVWPGYPRESRLVYKMLTLLSDQIYNSPFMKTIVSLGKDVKDGAQTAQRQFISTNISQISAIVEWLAKHTFDVNEALNYLLENMMKQKYLYSSNPNTPPRVDMANYDIILEYSDLFRHMCNSLDITKLSDTVKRNLKDYPPLVLEILIGAGLNLMEIVDGRSIAWWIMRSAKTFIVFANRQSLACAFISKFINSTNFDFHPRHFTGCVDYSAYEMLIKRPQFLSHLADEIEPGILFINTVDDDRIVANLINIGSPPPDQSIFHETLTNKITLLRRSYANNKAIFRLIDPKTEQNAFAYYCKYGDYTAQHLECLKFIAQEAPDTIHEVVQENPQIRRMYLCWTALHIACNRFSIDVFIAKEKRTSGETSVSGFIEIPDGKQEMQEEILEWIYRLYGASHIKLDFYHRTPLMCLPIDMSDAGREATKRVLEKYAKFDVAGLRALGFSIAEPEYVRYVLDWQRREFDVRKLDISIRMMHVSKKMVEDTAPWVHAKIMYNGE